MSEVQIGALGSRLIDQEPEPHNVKGIEVLVLGMPRTGTISLLAAFTILGYKPFHASMMEYIPHLHGLWLEAQQAKYLGTCRPYGRKEFDKLFYNGWNATINMPGSLFADELIEAYPNAKVVLSTRDVDRWANSMKESVDAAAKWKMFQWFASWDPNGMGVWWNYHKFQHSIRPILAPNGERQAYLDHYKRLNEILPPERVLNYNVAEGWEPLCKFLGKPIPHTEFPNVNNKNSFLSGRRRRWWRVVRVMLLKLAMPVAVVIAGSWWVWSTKSWRLAVGSLNDGVVATRGWIAS